jgi:hypothetical protein
MSQAITHFAVGATLTAVLIVLLVPAVRYPRTWVLVGGGWAMVPDAGKLVADPAVLAFHGTRWADLFWFHRTLDRLDPTDATLPAAVAVSGFIVVTLAAERRAYRTPAPIRNAVGDPVDD